MRRRAALVLLLAWSAAAQDSPEIVTRETSPTFQVRTNLVLVPVVVRDAKGHPIPNLKREDFQLFDKGKAQTITRFVVEAAGAAESSARGPETAKPGFTPPQRFVAYLFDDLHLRGGQIQRTRQAADRRLTSSFQPGERDAIYTITGRTALEFTDDLSKLRQTLESITPGVATMAQCPNISYYDAEHIVHSGEGGDAELVDLIIDEYRDCVPDFPTPNGKELERNFVRQRARTAQAMGENDTRAVLRVAKAVTRRMASMPGQRVLVVVSPGFYAARERPATVEVIDAALRAGVVIHAMDIRGLEALDRDASHGTPIVSSGMGLRTTLLQQATLAEQDAMATLTEGTGGTFFRNQNDLDLAFQRTAEIPEVRYLLGFTPESLKSDGTFHPLKVTLRSAIRDASVQARRGYFAPDKATDPAQTAKQEIEDAVFSREEIRDIPTEIGTQFFKPSDDQARLSVVTRIDLKELPYRKAEGRNRDDLTVISAVFDRDGNYVAGVQKVIEMRLLDQTLESAKVPPLSVKSDFHLKPGGYLVRVVVRDTEGQKIAAQNRVVEIPY